jgi:uncharacterized protein YceH (UPF0502 family)
MELTLSTAAVRVLGCLMEKEMSTPEYYPLSLNALVNACNQKTNRFPVVDFDEITVVRALDELKGYQMVWQSDASRVPKYGENFVKQRNLLTAEAALVCLLLLRGPQTLGELRGRSERMQAFGSIEEVEKSVATLIDADLIIKLPRQPGRKEARYAHLLAGTPEIIAETAAAPESATLVVRAENERLTILEQEVTALRGELADLRQAFEGFKGQFE